MAERVELALPDQILHFDDQRVADHRGGACVLGDLFAGGHVPCRDGARLGVRRIGEHIELADESAGALHGWKTFGGRFDFSMQGCCSNLPQLMMAMLFTEPANGRPACSTSYCH